MYLIMDDAGIIGHADTLADARRKKDVAIYGGFTNVYIAKAVQA